MQSHVGMTIFKSKKPVEKKWTNKEEEEGKEDL